MALNEDTAYYENALIKCRLALTQRVVAAYEGKQAEVLREAAGLRAALEHLQKEHRALVNQQVCSECCICMVLREGVHI